MWWQCKQQIDVLEDDMLSDYMILLFRSQHMSLISFLPSFLSFFKSRATLDNMKTYFYVYPTDL